MRSGKEAYDTVTTLAGFVATTYNVHVAVVAALIGGLSTAYVNGAMVALEVKLFLLIFYLFVAASSLIFLFDLYSRINAANVIARRLLLEEIGDRASDVERAAVDIMTRRVDGIVYRRLFPLIALIFSLMIVLFPQNLTVR